VHCRLRGEDAIATGWSEGFAKFYERRKSTVKHIYLSEVMIEEALKKHLITDKEAKELKEKLALCKMRGSRMKRKAEKLSR
jgi:hypothetical protein